MSLFTRGRQQGEGESSLKDSKTVSVWLCDYQLTASGPWGKGCWEGKYKDGLSCTPLWLWISRLPPASSPPPCHLWKQWTKWTSYGTHIQSKSSIFHICLTNICLKGWYYEYFIEYRITLWKIYYVRRIAKKYIYIWRIYILAMHNKVYICALPYSHCNNGCTKLYLVHTYNACMEDMRTLQSVCSV